MLWIADRHLFGIIAAENITAGTIVVDCGQAFVWYNEGQQRRHDEQLCIADRHLLGIITRSPISLPVRCGLRTGICLV